MIKAKNLKVGVKILRRVTDYSFQEVEVKSISIEGDRAYISFTEGIGYELSCSVDDYFFIVR